MKQIEIIEEKNKEEFQWKVNAGLKDGYIIENIHISNRISTVHMKITCLKFFPKKFFCNIEH